MENYNGEEMDQGTVTLVVDLAKAFENVQLTTVWAWAMHFGFRKEFIEYCVISVRCSLKDVWQIRCRLSVSSSLSRSCVSSALENCDAGCDN